MKKFSSEQLALFGKNRYHDWVIFFTATVVFIIASIAYNASLYIGTQSVISNSSEVAVIPSRFNDFKEDVEFLVTYLEGGAGTTAIDIPSDPSLR